MWINTINLNFRRPVGFLVEGQGHKTIEAEILPIPVYTHIPNLKGPSKILLKESNMEEISAAVM